MKIDVVMDLLEEQLNHERYVILLQTMVLLVPVVQPVSGTHQAVRSPPILSMVPLTSQLTQLVVSTPL